jgi:cyclopropane-fatty-acyl-phospholipid synthase
LVRKLLAACGNPPVDVEFWDGSAISASGVEAAGTIVIRSRAALWRLLTSPDVGFGECFSDGAIRIEGSLVDLMTTINRAVARISLNSVAGWLAYHPFRRHSHSIAACRGSIHHHYDIGNAFYRLWLDPRMQYTCAYFSAQDLTLEQAQFAKLEHVCRKLRLRPGERVFEAGCGWGGLALHMASRYGVSVRAFNLSSEQVAFAREQAEKQGLTGRVEFIEDDYRNVTGRYDAFISVGMLEHVGLESFPELGKVINRVLTPAGRGLLHSIGRNRPCPLDPWTDKHIFPGAYPPSLREMLSIFEPIGFSILDVENLRLHYARTLTEWLERFETAAPEVSRMFDDKFVRMWRMYLAGSIATFETGGLQLFQVVFARESNNKVPWTRDDLYRKAATV